MIAAIDRALGLAAGALAVAAAGAVTVLVAVTVVSVFWRYFLNAPIQGVEDISSMALTVAVAGAVAWGARQNAHISVNVINFFWGRGLTRLTDVLARGLGVTIVGLAAWTLWDRGGCGLPCGQVTNTLGIAHPPFYKVLSLALASYGVLLAVQLVTGLVHWRGEDPNEVAD